MNKYISIILLLTLLLLPLVIYEDNIQDMKN